MEELLGLIIFGVIAAISGLAKLMEKRKEEAQRSERPSPQRVDDLPEATRRMLYGDAPPPVAQKRGQAPPVATPRQAPPVPQRRPVPQSAPPRQAMPQRQQAPTPPLRRPVPSPQQPRPLATPRQQSAPQRRSAPQTPRQVWQQPQQPPQIQRRQPAQAPPPPAPPVPQRAAAAPDRAPAPRRRRKQASIKALLHHPKTLRTSIILHEVLSKPKSMR